MTQQPAPNPTKILLAEDDNDMRRFLVKALQNAGYDVIDYANGMEAYRRLRDFLQNEYLPRARDGVGLVSMRGGDRLYQRLIEENTTLPLTADEVHNLGLSEVARIRGEMETIKNRVGFRGTLAQFFEHLRTDRQFEPPSREWLREHYYDIGRRVDARIRQIFSTIPRSRL